MSTDDDYWTAENLPFLFDFPCQALSPDENSEGVEARCNVCGNPLDYEDLTNDVWTVLEHVGATNWQEILRGHTKTYIKNIVHKVFPDYSPTQVQQILEAVYQKANN